MKTVKSMFLALLLCSFFPGFAGANLFVSTQNDATLIKPNPNFSFKEDDIAHYQAANSTASFYWEWNGASENIDALHVIDGDRFLFSNTTNFSLGGKNFDYEDVVEYNKATGAASLFLDDRDVFRLAADIDAFSIYNGFYYISTEAAEDLLNPFDPGKDRVQEGDIAVYDPATGKTSIIGIFGSAAENIDAFHVLSNDEFLLSTTTAATLGGLGFDEHDIIRYNTGNGLAEMVLDGSEEFSLIENIDAVSVPIPAALWLMAGGLTGLGVCRKRK